MTESNVIKSREENQEQTKENFQANKMPNHDMEARKMSAEITTSAEEVTSSEKVTEVATEPVNENQSEKIASLGEMMEITKDCLLSD